MRPLRVLSVCTGVCLGLWLGLGLAFPAAALAQGRAGAETEADKVISEADAAFDAGNYEVAAPLYDRALLLDPTRTAVLVKRATLHFRERRYDKAIELLGRAERLSPDDLNVKAVLGLCLYQSQQKERGLRYLTEVASRRPEAYEAQFQIGQHFARLDPQRAITALSAYFAHRPEEGRGLDATARLHLGTAYFLRGQLPEAEDNLTRALAARQRDPQIQLTLGAVLLARGNHARAAQLHEPFLKDVQRRPAVAFNLAQSYLRLGRRTEAERLSAQYVGLRPADPRGHVLQGDVALFSPKDPDPRAAMRHYEEAERLAGKGGPGAGPAPAVNIEARKARARFLLRDPDGAIALAELALSGLRRDGADRDRERDEAELLALVIEAELSKVQAGAPPSPQLPELGARLSQLLPRDAHALALAGSAHLAGGEESLGKARRLYGEALAVDSRLPRARAGLARALGRQAVALLQEEREGAAQEAVALLEQALPYDETSGTRRNLAVAYLIQGRPAEAQRVLAPQGREPGPEMGRLWARTLLMLGKTGPALEAYERALAQATPVNAQGTGQKPEQKLDAIDLRIELGARYLSLRRWDEAVTTLEQALREIAAAAPADPEGAEARALAASRKVASRDLSLAYLSRGRARLREQEALLKQNPQAPGKLAEAALEDLLKAVERGGLQPGRRETGTVLCAAALAAVQSARYQQGRDLCGKAQAEGGCELLPPYDRLGVDLLLAYISYRDTGSPAQREKALRALAKLQGKAGAGSSVQPLNDLLKALLRSTHEMLAFDYFMANKVPRAAQLLKAAGRIQVPGGDADAAVLSHNLAVIDLQEGRAAGERALERLAGRPPEALVNLGILRDRRGEPKKALDLYRQALQRGARTPKLREWIDVKDRLFGEGP